MPNEMPFLDPTLEDQPLGAWMLNFIYHHSVFVNPGVAVIVQCDGFSMGLGS